MRIWFTFCIAALVMLVAPAYAFAQEKCVALRFDDGPGWDTTPGLLGILEKEKVHATFFIVGEMAQLHPELVKREFADGDEIANHSWDHPLGFERLSLARGRSEFLRTDKVLEGITGQRPTLIGAPGGEVSKAVEASFDRPFIGWDVDTEDWIPKYRHPQHVYNVAITVKPGQIVLMHDIRPTTVTAVPRIIATLKGRGMTFVTISGLAGCASGVKTSAKD